MGEGEEIDESKKSHRNRNAGRKAEKKKAKKEKDQNAELTDKQRNPKAFAFNSAVRGERRFRRKQDIETKKQHIPLVDRTPIEPPPILIAIVGPPKVGKSTLINNLIKLFTRSPLTDIKGPVTIVTGKKRRITLIECNNDINSMIDLAKVADLVLLMIDASFGFEMEIFEFLNICQVHGMPRVMGILTHLDMIKNSKTLKNTKKTLKHRFWTEVYSGAKLFYLSGILHGEYLRNEIKNLGRFISVMKFRPLTWRTTHSYLLGDRYEDLTNQEIVRKNPKCDRNVSLYGYVRGVPLNKNTSLHIAGFGDVRIQDVSYLPDPCPLPEEIKKRALVEKEKLIYAPFSGVGGIVYDKDAVYVELGGSHSHTKRDLEDESTNIVANLIETKETLDIKMQHSELQLFTDGKKITAKDMEDIDEDFENDKMENYVGNGRNEDDELTNELNQLRVKKEEAVEDSGRIRRKVVFEESDEELMKRVSEESESDEDKPNVEYVSLKENKDSEIHDKVSHVLKMMSKKGVKKQASTKNKSSSEDEDGYGSNSSSEEVNIGNNDSSSDDSGDEDEDSYQRKMKSKLDSDAESGDGDEVEESFPKKKKLKMESIDEDESNYHKKKKLKKSDEGEYSPKKKLKVDGDDSAKKKSKKKLKNDSNNDEDYSNGEFESEGSDDDIEEKKRSKIGDSKSSKKRKSNGVEESSDESYDELDASTLKMDDDEVEEEEDGSSGEENDDLAVKWKDNLAKKAEDAFLERQKSTHNLMKLVYGVFDSSYLKRQGNSNENAEEEEDEDGIGGLFKVISREQQKLKMEKDKMDLVETSLFMPWNANIRNWLEYENKSLIENCFVTGKWKESEDAGELLRLDAETLSDDGSDVFGDFEDLETGEKFDSVEKPKSQEPAKDDKADREALAEKKLKLKEKFDADYDNTEKTSYYDDLKTSAEKQSQLNKSVFENMPDDLRVQIEGYRAGMYVRIELENVPSEFITNFDPTYPIVIGSLNMGEENIGYVNVKIKKHRWYKKILKTGDPLIMSLGWRRFQTLPLYSKLEDDLKFRYLKYTPEHVTCNAHFWGPITPQGTGFLALQSCDGDNPEILKQRGFRIAATGAVQELDKSTQIMKKLKLIGYPMKIYKKTAFIKGMFNTSLEVAKFEGARIKTVSGIRGQIKKAASKPEGVFRATFEDKIQLSDIVFCRTWYKVDVQRFYNPVATLLLPPEKKNAWRGIRTTGEIKRDMGIRNQPAKDSLYTEIERDPKVFKPLIIPSKLQRALPYRDKPKHGVKNSEKKRGVERVAVIREPHEQKVSKMMKMIKTAYDHKQDQLKQQTKERMEKHRKFIEEQESRKSKKIKDKKKEVFRRKSKAQTRKENK